MSPPDTNYFIKMPKSAQFDKNEAIHKAMSVFWLKGYFDFANRFDEYNWYWKREFLQYI
jgi:hypothetical protein